jgi:2-polyprenyl-6-methoxyphenol hydroxylase-like FAD-dependent oxidoreductase
MFMRRIVIIGGGLGAMNLAIGLRQHGYDITVVAERAAPAVLELPLVSTQTVFGPALAHERALGINFWDDDVPPVRGISFAAAAVADDGSTADEPAFRWSECFDHAAQAVDQRVKVAAWMNEFARIGGEIRVHRVSSDDLQEYAREFELVVVATGRGLSFEKLFTRNAALSSFSAPQRAIGVFYVEPMNSAHDFSADELIFGLSPVGEFVRCPGLSPGGKVFGVGMFGLPGGPMDVWNGVTDIEQHFEAARQVVKSHFPWNDDLFNSVQPAGPREFLHGGVTPVVRDPVGVLDSGAKVLAMGDAAVTFDPVSGQGANMASRAAVTYQQAILDRGDRSFDEGFMRDAFGRYWEVAQHATRFSDDLLVPPRAHVIETLVAASELPEVAHRFAQLFSDPSDYSGWLTDEDSARAYLNDIRRTSVRRGTVTGGSTA